MKKRWESYVMYRQNEKLVEFWKEYYKDKSGTKVLFLLGKGFDPRMNNILKLFLENNPEQVLNCVAFDFPNEKDPVENKKLYDINSQQLAELKDQYGFGYEELKIDGSLPWDKRIAQMSRKVIDKDLGAYNDVIMDVSSLPRAFYFNIGKALFNKLDKDKSKNLFFAVSENVTIDELIKKTPVIDNIEPLVGFRSLSNRESNLDRINILISLMGDQNIDILRSIYRGVL